MYSQPKLIGKGTFGEVFKCQKIVDLREYAVKRVYFKVRNEKTLREHPIFREINVH
jgi:translation initiation factor 2-alpha kinase 4